MPGKIHGLSNHPIHKVWHNMKSRCYNQNLKQFKDYGGRGILVCEEWRTNYLAFHTWAMQNGWEKNLTIERINNDLGYSPLNCKFIPRKLQSRNQRTCIWIEAFGRKQILIDWVREKNIHRETIKRRLKSGWKIEDALTIRPGTVKTGPKPNKAVAL